jgi:hypothetical protein
MTMAPVPENTRQNVPRTSAIYFLKWFWLIVVLLLNDQVPGKLPRLLTVDCSQAIFS